MKKTFDLGFTPPEYGMMASTPAPREEEEEEQEKTYYPILSIEYNDDLAKMLAKAKEGTATISFKVTHTEMSEGSSREYRKDGCSVEMEITSMSVDPSSKKEDKEETAGEALDKFMDGK